MASTQDRARAPLALIVGQHEWVMRSFESVLASHGYTVLRSYDGTGMRRIPGGDPDLIVVEAAVPDVPWETRLAPFHRQRGIGPAIPIIATTIEPLTRERRIEALRAGAWEVYGLPVDAEELVLKAAQFVRAKMSADDSRDYGLLDPATDVYNVRGVLRRAYELGSEAFRYQRPLACVVVAPDIPEETEEQESRDPEIAPTLARLLREQRRGSDVIGRLGHTEFVVLAPETDPEGARKLAARLTEETALAGAVTAGGATSLALRAGYSAVTDFSAADVDAVELLTRATVALRRAQSSVHHRRISSFD